MYNVCCVVGCGSRRRDVNLYRFPKTEIGLNLWLKCINCEMLLSLSLDELRKRFVCEKHFEKRFLSSTPVRARLRAGAYPALFSEAEILSGFPQTKNINDYAGSVLSEHNYGKKKKHEDHTYSKSGSVTKYTRSDTGRIPSEDGHKRSQHEDHTYCANVVAENTRDTGTHPVSQDMLCKAMDIPSTSGLVGQPFMTTMPIAEDKNVSSASQLCESQQSRKGYVCKKKVFMKTYKNLYNEYKKSMKQLNYHKRIRRAQKFLKDKTFEKMNSIGKKILLMQMKLCLKKGKGRRFTDEEKVIALSILKQSPKCYKFLRRIFILPSKCTLNKMIAGLAMETGINAQIFDTMKMEVTSWEEKRKFCSILFDEISLEPAVNYEKNNDAINGFVELVEKSSDFADHALVFMLRGAVCKWQQPLAFYFCKGATPAVQLKTIIKEIVIAVGKTGLLPVALICDQGTTFQSALKSLSEDTRREQIIKGERIEQVINIEKQKLSIIFDPPHLLKGLRNNFITKCIKYKNKISKWTDIVQVYKTDCQHAQARLLHKLNDEHVIPEKIKKMKVKNCVRVLSKTMAAALSYTAQFSQYADGSSVSPT